MKFILLVNANNTNNCWPTMPTIVGILTYIGRMNTTSESYKARKSFTFSILCCYEQLKCHAQLRLSKEIFLLFRSQDMPHVIANNTTSMVCNFQLLYVIYCDTTKPIRLSKMMVCINVFITAFYFLYRNGLAMPWVRRCTCTTVEQIPW